MDHPDLFRWARPEAILAATDLHDLDRLMPVAIQQAGESGARLILMHVLAASTALWTDEAGHPYYNPACELEFIDKNLNPWCELARQKGVRCDALVREGNPAQQIAAAARQFQANRVLLGTRSRSKLSKLLLGSVAEQVLRSVNLPVITVGPEAHLPVGEGGEQVVLHATTLRETSRPGAALACQIAMARKQRLVLLHVLPFADEMERKQVATALDSVATAEIESMAAEARAKGCPAVEPVVVHGNPFIEILAAAEEQNASLIVLGAADRSAFANLTRDRTVYRVLAHAGCPVLTLREPESKAALDYEEPWAALHR